MLPALLDLLTGSACPGCGRAGHLLCPACEGELAGAARPAWPTPCPPGLVPPWAAGEYDGLLRQLVLAHKERHQLGLAGPLGRLLAGAVAAAVPDRLDGRPLVLVPVPSRTSTTRSRGHDPTHAIVRHAAGALRASGYDALPRRLLRLGRVLDQAGLDSRARAQNLAGAMSCPSTRLSRLADRCSRAMLVVCDDVLTTGATAREAQRALEAAGAPPAAIATVAATRKRRTGGL